MSIDLQASPLRHEAALADRRGRLRSAERGLALTTAAAWSGGPTMRPTDGRRPGGLVAALRRLAGATGTAVVGSGT